MVVVGEAGDDSKSSKTVGDIVSVNEYKECDNYNIDEADEIYDPNALRFFSELVKHYSKYA